MMTIRRVGPFSCAKIAGTLYAIIGVIFGFFVSLASIFGAFTGSSSESGFMGMLFGIGAVVLLPIFYGCMGFVMTLVSAWLYNALAGALGGIEVDIS